MKIRGIQDETLQDYKEISMLVCAAYCDWKCCKELGKEICQNSDLSNQPAIEISNVDLCKRYLDNKISQAFIFGGLEPMLQFSDVIDIIDKLRNEYHCNDPIIIYTGYYENEIQDHIRTLSAYKNIIVKFGRFLPNRPPIYDHVLGIYLASANQYAAYIGGQSLIIKLNPNKEIVKQVKQKLKENDGYCPCRTSKNLDTKCICKEFREQSEPGACYCQLYIKQKENK